MDYVKLHKHFREASENFESSERVKLSHQSKIMYWNKVIDSILEHDFTTREKLNAIKFLIFSLERTLNLHEDSMEYHSARSLQDDRQTLSSIAADIREYTDVREHQGDKNV